MLTPKQLRQLRSARLNGRNKLRYAMNLVEPRVTQMELAKAVGVYQPYISKLVNNEYGEISLENSRRIALFFGCETDDLFPFDPRRMLRRSVRRQEAEAS